MLSPCGRRRRPWRNVTECSSRSTPGASRSSTAAAGPATVRRSAPVIDVLLPLVFRGAGAALQHGQVRAGSADALAAGLRLRFCGGGRLRGRTRSKHQDGQRAYAGSGMGHRFLPAASSTLRQWPALTAPSSLAARNRATRRRPLDEGTVSMKCVLVGSRFFGASVFEALRQEDGVAFVAVVAPAADDRLALAAQKAGVPVHVLADPKIVPGEAVPAGSDLVVAAHTHARVSNEALAHARLGGIGYHPSLLPRHRGIAAVEWTILEGDAIAGGSVYHLADGWDAGAVAAQDWC